jgi:hypothetical protein
MEQIEGKNYLTIPEVMERLNVCRQTVLRYRLSKKLDFIRLRGKIYITEESYNNMFIPESEKITLGTKGEVIDKEELRKFVDEFSSEECKDDREFIYILLHECEKGKKIYKTIKVINFETCQIICSLISKEPNCPFARETITKHIRSFITSQHELMGNIKSGEVTLFCNPISYIRLELHIVSKLTLNNDRVLVKEATFGAGHWS